MSKETASTSGEANAASGASASDGSSVNESKAEKTYPADFVEKLKKEKENFKKELEALRAKESNEQETKLKEKEEFKKLADLKAKEADQYKAEKAALEEKIKLGQINGAVKAELEKLGLDATYSEDVFKLLDKNIKDVVTIDPDTQMVVGADEIAKQAYQKYSGLGFFKKQSATANHSASKAVTQTKPDISKMNNAQLLDYWKSLKSASN